MNAKTSKELRKITNRIPEELLSKLMVEKEIAPSVIEVAKRALEDPEVDEKLKKKLKNIVDGGYLNGTEFVADHEIEKQIDDWLEKEIDIAVKDGRIPDPQTDKDLDNYRKKVKKVTKWKNKNTQKSSLKTSKDK